MERITTIGYPGWFEDDKEFYVYQKGGNVVFWVRWYDANADEGDEWKEIEFHVSPETVREITQEMNREADKADQWHRSLQAIQKEVEKVARSEEGLGDL